MATRTFIGLPMPEPYQRAAGRLARDLGKGLASKVSWVKPGNWHLTLKFLGDVEEDQVEDIGRALGGVDWEPFVLQAAGGGFFPDGRRPRVVWTGLAKGGPESRALAASVEKGLAPLGFEPENRPFRAHLTLGRVRRAGRDQWGDVLAALNREAWPETTMDHFVLWKSELSPQGPAYTRLAEFPAPSQS